MARSDSHTEPANGDLPKRFRCSVCQDAGYQKLLPTPFSSLVPCKCRKAEQDQLRKEELERMSNLSNYKDKLFSNFYPTNASVREAYIKSLEYAASLPGWLVLAGHYGVGKTHLAAAIGNEVLQRRQAVVFMTVPDLMDQLRATFSEDADLSFKEVFDKVKTAPLLILDDLGTQNATGWSKEKLFQIIDWRYVSRLPTVVTSNVWPEGVDGRLVSRLSDTSLSGGVIQIDAPDYRTQPRREPEQS